MKTIVFTLGLLLTASANAAFFWNDNPGHDKGILWDCPHFGQCPPDYAPEVPEIEDVKPPVDRMPVDKLCSGNYWECEYE